MGKSVDDDEAIIPWSIDNKYYTAEVLFLPVDISPIAEAGVPRCDVLIYVVGEVPRSIPPALVKAVVDEPKDISLAVRTSRSSDPTESTDTHEPQGAQDAQEFDTEVFDEVGMDFVDEQARPEDDDERRKSSSLNAGNRMTCADGSDGRNGDRQADVDDSSVAEHGP